LFKIIKKIVVIIENSCNLCSRKRIEIRLKTDQNQPASYKLLEYNTPIIYNSKRVPIMESTNEILEVEFIDGEARPVVLKMFDGNTIYEKLEYDWYMTVALEKVDKVTQDRHLLTSKLILRYRWAIREGYNHELDHNLKNKYDYPRNQNTVRGIQIYIERIEKASNAEMTALKNE
jgi:hypothetical protein